MLSKTLSPLFPVGAPPRASPSSSHRYSYSRVQPHTYPTTTVAKSFSLTLLSGDLAPNHHRGRKPLRRSTPHHRHVFSLSDSWVLSRPLSSLFSLVLCYYRYMVMAIYFLCWYCNVTVPLKSMLNPFLFGLNIALVPANMFRLSFGPCKKKNLFLVPANFFVF